MRRMESQQRDVEHREVVAMTERMGIWLTSLTGNHANVSRRVAEVPAARAALSPAGMPRLRPPKLQRRASKSPMTHAPDARESIHA